MSDDNQHRIQSHSQPTRADPTQDRVRAARKASEAPSSRLAALVNARIEALSGPLFVFGDSQPSRDVCVALMIGLEAHFFSFGGWRVEKKEIDGVLALCRLWLRLPKLLLPDAA